MTVAETYLVLFAALGTADTLFFGWLLVTALVCGLVIFKADSLTRVMSNWLLVLYGLFAVVVIGRWGIVLTKVLDLLDALRELGESLPAQQISMVFGIAAIALFFLGSGVTIRLILGKRSRVRVI